MAPRTGIFHENYAKDMAVLNSRLKWGFLTILLLFIAVCPFFLSSRMLTILTTMGIAIVSVHGLNILTGYCGQISIGHSGFMAVGGYTSAVLCAKLGWPFFIALPCAALTAGIAGLLFGLPSLKIKGFYLIMATIAAQFIIIWFIIQLRSITGGTDGLLIPKATIGGFPLNTKISFFYMVMIFACLATITAHNIVRTRSGRAFIAIRDNDLAAEVMGVSLWHYKLQAFFIGCVYAGVAGALLVQYVRFASVEQFPFMDSVWYLGMLIVGGMGNTTGAILGVIALKVLDELVTVAGPIIAAVVAPQAAASLALISHGLVIMIFLIFEPRGLHHRWKKVKTYFRLWPYSHEVSE
jgi:branched-chain amino acid transport system permease protein